MKSNLFDVFNKYQPHHYAHVAMSATFTAKERAVYQQLLGVTFTPGDSIHGPVGRRTVDIQLVVSGRQITPIMNAAKESLETSGSNDKIKELSTPTAQKKE